MQHDCTSACTRGWSPSKKCHCSLCGNDFSTVVNFDKHQDKTGERVSCLPPEKAGLAPNGRGVYVRPGEVDLDARFGRAAS